MSDTMWIILVGAVLTYLTRVGGHLVLSRFSRIPPRVEAALDAVPAAVLTALVAPYAVHGTLSEAVVLAVAAILSLRLSIIPMLAIGWALVTVARASGLSA